MVSRWIALVMTAALMLSGCIGLGTANLTTPTPLTAPEPILAPTLTLNEETATPGEEITVVGTDFTPGAELALRLNVADAGLDGETLAVINVGETGDFEVTMGLPAVWTETGAPITERELVITAVDPVTDRRLTTAFLLNAAATIAANYEPLPAVACEEVREAVATRLDLDATLATVSFIDYLTGQEGIGCQITVTGTGLDFPHFVGVAMELEAMLTERGWIQDTAYEADGPTGMVLGMRMDGRLALLNVGWEPSEDAECSVDVAISECELAPEQQIYTITLLMAQDPAEPTNVEFVSDRENVALVSQQTLMQQLQADPAAVTVVTVEEAEWPDGCLGLPAESESCPEATVPGYRVTLTAEGGTYIYRTDAGVTAMRLESAPVPQIGEWVSVWKSPADEEICTTIEIGDAGVAWGLCGQVLMQGHIADPIHDKNRAEFVTTYDSFAAETSAGLITFQGEGSRVATLTEQRMIAEWARLVYKEVSGKRLGGQPQVALTWHRRGGSAGFCDDLTIYRTGDVYAGTCVDMEPELLVSDRLNITQMGQMYQWIDSYQGFNYEQTDPTDNVTLRMELSATGEELPMEAETQEILDFAAQLYADLVGREP